MSDGAPVGGKGVRVVGWQAIASQSDSIQPIRTEIKGAKPFELRYRHRCYSGCPPLHTIHTSAVNKPTNVMSRPNDTLVQKIRGWGWTTQLALRGGLMELIKSRLFGESETMYSQRQINLYLKEILSPPTMLYFISNTHDRINIR